MKEVAAGRIQAGENTQAVWTPAAGIERPPATILLVDDEPAVLGLASEVLGALGYHILCAADANEAVADRRAFIDPPAKRARKQDTPEGAPPIWVLILK